MKHPHNELSEEQILELVKKQGYLGRHKYKNMNSNINKKLNRMVKKGMIKILKNTRDYRYFGDPTHWRSKKSFAELSK